MAGWGKTGGADFASISSILRAAWGEGEAMNLRWKVIAAGLTLVAVYMLALTSHTAISSEPILDPGKNAATFSR